MSFQGYAALKEKSPLEIFNYEPQVLGPHDVEISITHCGICHSDIHLIDNDWKTNIYPLVPGHEIIGIIKTLGTEVKHLHKNQRVGIGWQSDCCGKCEWCLVGEENSCSQQKATCLNNYGGFANAICMNSRFVFPIPEKLLSEKTAPLLCGGITVYSPLKQYITRLDMHIGVIGVGGLGHLALQFAHALGAKVTAFSSTPEKAAETASLGADYFINHTDKSALTKARNTLDFILCTVTAPLDWMAYLNILRPKGKLCFVSGLSTPINVPVNAFIRGRKTICGSNIGSCHEITEMLEFAALHNISAWTESLPMSDVNTALDKVRHNQARYRMVLVNN